MTREELPRHAAFLPRAPPFTQSVAPQARSRRVYGKEPCSMTTTWAYLATHVGASVETTLALAEERSSWRGGAQEGWRFQLWDRPPALLS